MIVQIGIHCGGWENPELSEKIVFRWNHWASKCQASSVWFALSIPLGFRHFDIYRFWETLSYLCWYFCRTQRRVCAWVLKIIKHKHEWKQDALNHNCLETQSILLPFLFYLIVRPRRFGVESFSDHSVMFTSDAQFHTQKMKNFCLLSTRWCVRNFHMCYLIQSLDIWR